MPRCLTWNPTLEWAGSTAHVPVGMAVLVAVAVVIEVLLKLDACSNKLANASVAPFACGGKLGPGAKGHPGGSVLARVGSLNPRIRGQNSQPPSKACLVRRSS